MNIFDKNGRSRDWYMNGQPHQEDSTVIVCEDGPAVIYSNGKTEKWYVHGIQYANNAQCKWVVAGLAGIVI